MTVAAKVEPLGAAFLKVLAIRQQMRADGASQSECDAVVEHLLRERFPQAREWKYLCGHCADTGWMFRVCPGRPCQREKPHAPHDYVLPCVCSLGDAHRQRPRTEQDFTQAVKTPKQPTRFGR